MVDLIELMLILIKLILTIDTDSYLDEFTKILQSLFWEFTWNVLLIKFMELMLYVTN